MQSNPLFEGFLRQTGYLAAEPAVREGEHLCLGIVRVGVVGQPFAQIFVAEGKRKFADKISDKMPDLS